MSHTVPKPSNVRKLHSHETPSQLAKVGYDTHAQAYLNWTTSQPSSSRMHYLQQVLDRLSRDRATIYNGTSPSSEATSQPSKPQRSGKILDLGCGAGVPVTLALARSEVVQRVIATDISQTQLDLLREKLRQEDGDADGDCDGSVLRKVEVVKSDMLDLSFERGSFIAVVAFFSLIHLARGDQKIMIQRIWEWLDVGGYLCANFGVINNDREEDKDDVQAQIKSEEEKGEDPTELTGSVVEGWLGMTAYWDGYGVERTKAILKDVCFEVVVADVVEEVGDATFFWIIARKLNVS